MYSQSMHSARTTNKYHLLSIVFDGGYFPCIMDRFVKRIYPDAFSSIHCTKRSHTCPCDLHVVWGCTYPTRHSQVGHPSTPHLYPTSQEVGQLNDVTQSTLC